MDINNIKRKILGFFHDFEHNEQKRNRVLILFLVSIGVCSVFLGFSNTKQAINKPFIDKEKDAIASVYDTYNQLKAQGKIKDDTVVDSKNINTDVSNFDSNNADTDGDGISDYDETNVFKTSAFLSDSDGDGISDYDEVKVGTDPNCAVGKDCSSVSITNASKNNADINYNAIDISKMDIKQSRIELEKIIPESLKPMLANMTDDQIRSLMSQLYTGTVSSNNTNIDSTINTNPVGSTDYKSVLRSKLPQFTTAQITTMKEMSEVDIKKILLDSNIVDEALLFNFKIGELKATVLGE